MKRVWTIVGIMAGALVLFGALFAGAWVLLPQDAAVFLSVFLVIAAVFGLSGLAVWLDHEVPR